MICYAEKFGKIPSRNPEIFSSSESEPGNKVPKTSVFSESEPETRNSAGNPRSIDNCVSSLFFFLNLFIYLSIYLFIYLSNLGLTKSSEFGRMERRLFFETREEGRAEAREEGRLEQPETSRLSFSTINE